MNVGLFALYPYIPKKVFTTSFFKFFAASFLKFFNFKYVSQDELEAFDNVSKGKYTIGLGQTNMSICDDSEDINSICLTAVSNLLKSYNINPTSVGYLGVGTETIIDKSKSVKTVFLLTFGIDSKNACYGGTSALFDAIHWLESSYVDTGKEFAIVVAADIAVYKTGAARPTGGAGAIAMLLGRNAPIVFDQGLRSTYMDHVWDFYKPDLHSEYPEVDGPLSNKCYLKAIDNCYNGYMDRFSRKMGVSNPNFNVADFYLFHCPYTKLVQKSFGRIAFNDYIRNRDSFPLPEMLSSIKGDLTHETTYTDKNVEKAFMQVSGADFEKKVAPGLLAAKNCGNMYCGSLYAGLASLISEVELFQDVRIVLFSYGSGLASSMFSMTVKSLEHVSKMKRVINLRERLNQRSKIAPEQYDAIMALRAQTHCVKSYKPMGNGPVFPGTFLLTSIDDMFRRSYKLVGESECDDEMEFTPPMTPTAVRRRDN